MHRENEQNFSKYLLPHFSLIATILRLFMSSIYRSFLKLPLLLVGEDQNWLLISLKNGNLDFKKGIYVLDLNFKIFHYFDFDKLSHNLYGSLS